MKFDNAFFEDGKSKYYNKSIKLLVAIYDVFQVEEIGIAQRVFVVHILYSGATVLTSMLYVTSADYIVADQRSMTDAYIHAMGS